MDTIFTFIKENYLFIIVGIIVSIIFVCLIYLVRYVNRKEIKEENIIMGNLTTPRIFILNFLEGKVTYFDRGFFHNRKCGPIVQFYAQFTAKEIDRLEEWVNSLLIKKSGTTLSYRVDVFVKSMRRSYASLLEVTKIDYDKKIIHLESFLYRYLKPNDQMNLTIKKRENIGYLDDFNTERLFERRRRREIGIYGAINLALKNPKQSKSSDIPPHILYELQNQVAFYRSRRRIVRFEENNTVGLFLTNAVDVNSMIEYLSKITKRIRAYLEINGYEDISIACGIARARQFSDFKMCIKTAQELSFYAHREESKMYIYDPNREITDLDLSLYRNEVTQIINKKGVDVFFQPLIDTHSVEILGYLASLNVTGNRFPNYIELMKVARENKLNEQLTKMVLRKTVAAYYNLRRNPKHLLFIPLDVENVHYLRDVFSAQPFAEDLNFVFILEEDDFSNSFDETEKMSEVIKTIKELGHAVALVITEAELTLPDIVYSGVDYFMVNNKILTYTRSDERERLYLLSTLGKLLRHQKPILISDLSKWSEIEYYIRAGVDYVASDEISRKDTALQTIDKKRALRIINFSKRK